MQIPLSAFCLLHNPPKRQQTIFHNGWGGGVMEFYGANVGSVEIDPLRFLYVHFSVGPFV